MPRTAEITARSGVSFMTRFSGNRLEVPDVPGVDGDTSSGSACLRSHGPGMRSPPRCNRRYPRAACIRACACRAGARQVSVASRPSVWPAASTRNQSCRTCPGFCGNGAHIGSLLEIEAARGARSCGILHYRGLACPPARAGPYDGRILSMQRAKGEVAVKKVGAARVSEIDPGRGGGGRAGIGRGGAISGNRAARGRRAAGRSWTWRRPQLETVRVGPDRRGRERARDSCGTSATSKARASRRFATPTNPCSTVRPASWRTWVNRRRRCTPATDYSYRRLLDRRDVGRCGDCHTLALARDHGRGGHGKRQACLR